ncbi:MAG: SH3 domain-containing protein [Clostridiales bacterium]|nr:SH3 domain-containing protein [Clostridiales bacterium]
MKRLLLVLLAVSITIGLAGCIDSQSADQLSSSDTPRTTIEAHPTEEAAPPPDVMGEIVNVKEFANVRAEPSLDADILGQAVLGSQWVVLNTSIDGGWTEIRHGEQIGYVRNDYISVLGQPNTVPTETPSVFQMALVAWGYTDEQASNIERVLNSIGITKCTIIKADKETSDGMRVVACYFNGSSNSGYFATVHGEVAVVGSGTDTWYDTEQGGIIKQYEDTNAQSSGESVVSTEAEIILMQIAEDVAIQIAKNPSTVKFKTLYWGFWRDGSTYAVEGTFTCSNLMGVKEENVLRIVCEASADYKKIQPYEVWLNGKQIK